MIPSQHSGAPNQYSGDDQSMSSRYSGDAPSVVGDAPSMSSQYSGDDPSIFWGTPNHCPINVWGMPNQYFGGRSTSIWRPAIYIGPASIGGVAGSPLPGGLGRVFPARPPGRSVKGPSIFDGSLTKAPLTQGALGWPARTSPPPPTSRRKFSNALSESSWWASGPATARSGRPAPNLPPAPPRRPLSQRRGLRPAETA